MTYAQLIQALQSAVKNKPELETKEVEVLINGPDQTAEVTDVFVDGEIEVEITGVF